MDVRETIRQIGVGNLMAVGALPWRDLVQGDNKLQFTVGSNRGLLEKIVISLACDTYTVEYVVMRKGTCEELLRETEEGIYDDMLGLTVRKMGDRAWTAEKLKAAQFAVQKSAQEQVTA